jgi:hypothetical protein
MYPIYYPEKAITAPKMNIFAEKFKIKTASCINLCTQATGIVGERDL